MKIDLLDLLATRAISNPSRVRSATLADGVVTLTIEGWAWWRETEQDREGLIRLTFRGLQAERLICWTGFQATISMKCWTTSKFAAQ